MDRAGPWDKGRPGQGRAWPVGGLGRDLAGPGVAEGRHKKNWPPEVRHPRWPVFYPACTGSFVKRLCKQDKAKAPPISSRAVAAKEPD